MLIRGRIRERVKNKMSPTVLRIGPYKFFFYSREETKPHIHVEEGSKTAKFWINPISLAQNFGFAPNELNKIKKRIEENEELFLREWREFHG